MGVSVGSNVAVGLGAVAVGPKVAVGDAAVEVGAVVEAGLYVGVASSPEHAATRAVATMVSIRAGPSSRFRAAIGLL